MARALDIAQGSAAESLQRLADGVDAWNAREERRERPLEPFRRSDRVYDGLGRQIPRNVFRGSLGVGTLLRLGMAAQFAAVVPSPCLTEDGVLCRCGHDVVVSVGEVAECGGGCGRWFLRTETSVRVARWPRAEEA